MKTKIKILSFCSLFFLVNNYCENQDFNGFVEGYLVGSFQCPDLVNPGFCIILENNIDSLYTFSLPENIFEFPIGVLKTGHDANTGGPFFFPDSLRYNYKIKFKIRKPTDSEIVKCVLPYNTFGPTFSWNNWEQIIAKDFVKSIK